MDIPTLEPPRRSQASWTAPGRGIVEAVLEHKVRERGRIGNALRDAPGRAQSSRRRLHQSSTDQTSARIHPQYEYVGTRIDNYRDPRTASDFR